MNQENILTSISKGSGCGCKIQPAVLAEMLNGLSVDIDKFPNLLVGNHLNDDCSVYDWVMGNYCYKRLIFSHPW